MTSADQLSVFLASALAAAAIAGYLADAMGFGVAPLFALVAALAAGAYLAWRARPPRRDAGDGFAWLGIVLFVLATLFRLAWPALVPPGRGPDLTHHLLLVDYIERSGHLVHDRSLDGSMGEMAHYTPGAHVLAVLFGAWSGLGALRAFYPLLALCTALTAGFVYLIARRHGQPMPYALAAVILLFLPSQYFYGAFTHDGFLAQAVATSFAVAAWWAIVAWDERRERTGAVLVGLFLAATFLSWPIWIGPLVIVFVATARQHWCHLAIGLAPLAMVSAVHVIGRWGWFAIVRTSGAVLEPGLTSLGWVLPLLAAGGLIAIAGDRRARVTVVMVLIIAVQAVALYAIATSQGAPTPYMAFKMVYLAIYPMAVLAAAALERGGRRLREWSDAAGWLLASILVLAIVRPALAGPRAVPVVDLDLYAAGGWARSRVGRSCVDYLVRDAHTAYWLHLAVLGNPRSSDRMREIDGYDPNAAIAPWIAGTGRGFAIADLRLLPGDVRSRVEIVAQFGDAAVIKRPDAAPCYN